MIITAIRTELPYENPTDVEALLKTAVGAPATDAITTILKWKNKVTDIYIQNITGLSLTEIQAAANSLATANPPLVTIE